MMIATRKLEQRFPRLTIAIAAVLVPVVAGPHAARGDYIFSKLADFDGGAAGYDPFGSLVLDASGNLYGASVVGGDFGAGAVFRYSTVSGSLSPGASFNDGAFPIGGLTLGPDGRMYGTTIDGGGPGNIGVLYRYDPASESIETLHAFAYPADGQPLGRVAVDAAGDVYGVVGGANGGALFRYSAATGDVEKVATLAGLPSGGVTMDAAGNVYGMTSDGGAHGLGTVFKYDAASATLATIADLDADSGDSPFFSGIAVDARGNLYGETFGGGAYGLGTVFRIDAAGSLETLVSFDGENGGTAYGELVLDAHGNVFGTSLDSVFRIDAATGAFSILHTFSSNPADLDGFGPFGLVVDAFGNVYGTTEAGGLYGGGTIFVLSVVPEPSSLVLLAAGLAGASLVARRRRERTR